MARLEKLGSHHLLERLVLPRKVLREEHHVGISVPGNDLPLHGKT